MREKDAIRKTCCHSMASENATNCLGSNCMAWMWHKKKKSHGAAPHVRQIDLPESEWQGYCGLAGQPSC